MSCVLCFSECVDVVHCIKACCQYHHRFHPSCIKIKYNFVSSALAGESVKEKCPVCSDNNIMGAMSALSTHLSKLNKLEKLDIIETSTEKLIEKVDRIAAKQEDLANKFMDLESRVIQLEKLQTTSCSSGVIEKITKAANFLENCNFEQRALQIETLALADELSISGLCEQTNEDLKVVVDKLFCELNISGSQLKVKSARRIGKLVETGTQSKKPKYRDIVIKCDSKDTVDLLISKSKGVAIHGDKLLHSKDNKQENLVRLHRRHPPILYKFRQSILKNYPILPPKNVWIMSSALFIRTDPNKPPLRLSPSSDLEKLNKYLQ